MPILSTVFRGTHKTYWQITATFRTRLISESPLTIIVELELNLGGETSNNSFVLGSVDPIQQVNITRGNKSMKGELKLIEQDRAITYQGNILIPDNVNIAFDSGIVSIF